MKPVLCRPGDPRLFRSYDEAGGWEQEIGCPTFLVIGRTTSVLRCAELASRFGLNEQTILAFRESVGGVQ